MKKILTLITVIVFLISCKSESKKTDGKAPDKTLTEKIADEAGKIISEDVYEIKKGEKGGKVFIIEDEIEFGLIPPTFEEVRS